MVNELELVWKHTIGAGLEAHNTTCWKLELEAHNWKLVWKHTTPHAGSTQLELVWKHTTPHAAYSWSGLE